MRWARATKRPQSSVLSSSPRDIPAAAFSALTNSTNCGTLITGVPKSDEPSDRPDFQAQQTSIERRNFATPSPEQWCSLPRQVWVPGRLLCAHELGSGEAVSLERCPEKCRRVRAPCKRGQRRGSCPP